MSTDENPYDQEITPEERAARLVQTNLDGLGKQVAKIRPQPFGVPHLTSDQELWGWMYYDDSVDHDALLAQGLKPSQVAARKFPLQQHLMEQAGTSFDEQNAYAMRQTARAMRAYASGRMPQPPPRGPQKLTELAPPTAQAPAPMSAPPDPNQLQGG